MALQRLWREQSGSGNKLNFEVVNKPQLFNGIKEITTDAQALSTDADGKVQVKRCQTHVDSLLLLEPSGPGKMEMDEQRTGNNGC